jgi:hypothetical protein
MTLSPSALARPPISRSADESEVAKDDRGGSQPNHGSQLGETASGRRLGSMRASRSPHKQSRMSVLRTLPRCRTRRRGLAETEIAWLRCSLEKLSMTLSPNASTLLPRFR